MLTALEDDADQMKGFDALADDYMIKPVSMQVLIRRIEAVLRRTKHPCSAEPGVIRCKHITLHGNRSAAFVDGEPISLTACKRYGLSRRNLDVGPDVPGRLSATMRIISKSPHWMSSRLGLPFITCRWIIWSGLLKWIRCD